MPLDRRELLTAFPLQEQMVKDGLVLIGSGPIRKALCPFHNEKTPSLNVNIDKALWYCFGCQKGGSIIDWIVYKTGKSVEEVMRELSNAPAPAQPDLEVVATYVYRDALGGAVYRVLRYQPKTFKQQRKLPGVDAWAWGMDGVERVLYRLPEVLAAKENEAIWITAGEKDVETLVALGFNATTNVGGEGKWLEGYTEWLAGKDVVICGDNDEPGRKHIAKVCECLDGKVRRLRVVKIPSPDKDISDFRVRFGTVEACQGAVVELLAKAVVMVAGATVPVLSMAEMEDRYIALQKEVQTVSYSFKDWLPTFGAKLRPCVPGDVIAFVASTGAGKTAALQNLAFTSGLRTLLFEFELSEALTFERFVAISLKMRADEVEAQYRGGFIPGWRDTALSNVYVSPVSGINTSEMERVIERSALKMDGQRPVLVLVDYVQLMRGQGKSRYEQMTAVASEIKSVAKNTGTIIVVASQVSRKEDPNAPVGLNDGKDSGQIENSAALHLGLWRDKEDNSLLHMRVNKSTRDLPGLRIKCNFDGPSMRITERSRVEDNGEATRWAQSSQIT